MKDKFLNILLILLLIGMILANLNSVSLETIIFSLTLSLIFFLCYYINKKHHFISLKVCKISFIILFIIGLLLRFYLIFNYNYTLESDYKLYFDTASNLFNNKSLLDTYYLSFNTYVVIFSSVLSIIFKIFGSSIMVAQIFNLVCQILTMVFIYKIIKYKNDSYLKYLFPLLWFIMPSTTFTCLLISTENLFILLFVICLYLFFRLENIDKLSTVNIFCFIFLGLMLSLGNNIRSVMTAFLIALIVYYVFTHKKAIKYLFLGVTICSFFTLNILLKGYVKIVLDDDLRKGSNIWALYFGANYQSFGMITESDSSEVFEVLALPGGDKKLLQMTIKRYQDMGLLKWGNLYAHKFVMLWSDNTIMHDSANLMSGYRYSSYLKYYNDFGEFFLKMLLFILGIYWALKGRTNKEEKLLTIFLLIYVIANLFIVVNGRYAYPVWLLLFLLVSFNYSQNKHLDQRYH